MPLDGGGVLQLLIGRSRWTGLHLSVDDHV
jgi:hypothetical protein